MLKPHLFKLSLNVTLITTNLSQLWFCCLQLSVARLMQTAVTEVLVINLAQTGVRVQTLRPQITLS